MQATIYTIDGKQHEATLTETKINEIVSLIHLTEHRSLEIRLSDSEVLVLDSANVVGLKYPNQVKAPAQAEPEQAAPQQPAPAPEATPDPVAPEIDPNVPPIDAEGPISDI